MKKFEKLTREQMKNVVGGNPNCAGLDGDYDWTCCGSDRSVHVGVMACDQASSYCNGGTLTTSPDESFC